MIKSIFWLVVVCVVVVIAAQEQQVEIGPDGSTIMSATTTTTTATATTASTPEESQKPTTTINDVTSWIDHPDRKQDEMCTSHIDVCTTITQSELYTRRTGNAMMYKPNQPEQRLIYKENHKTDSILVDEISIDYDWDNLDQYENFNYTYREWNSAYNTLARESYIRKLIQPPQLFLFVYLWNCSNSIISTATDTNNDSNNKQCCCKKLQSTDGRIDIWHSYPNGTYPSLRKGVDDYNCRGHIPLNNGNDDNAYDFYTYPPGSTGLFNGLYYTTGYDLPPYSPPVVHFLVQSTDMSIDDLLIDVPILFENINKSYVSKEFEGPDIKSMMYGTYTLKQSQSKFYNIRSWIPRYNDNIVEVAIDLFLQPLRMPTTTTSTSTTNTKGKQIKQPLCSPRKRTEKFASFQSLFREPMALCSPDMIDYFQ